MNEQEEKILLCWKGTIQTLKKSTSLGFCLSHLEILITVYLNDGITRNDLHECIVTISSTTLKRYVKDLVNEYEYITETNSDGDSRIKQLHVSERGQKTLITMIDKVKDALPACK